MLSGQELVTSEPWKTASVACPAAGQEGQGCACLLTATPVITGDLEDERYSHQEELMEPSVVYQAALR